MRSLVGIPDSSLGTLACLAALVALPLAVRFPFAAASPPVADLLAKAMPPDLRDRLPLTGARDGVSYVVRSVEIASLKGGLPTFDIDCTARVGGKSLAGHVVAARGRDGVPRWVGPAPDSGLGAGGDPDLAGRASVAVGRAVLDYVATLPGGGAGTASPSSFIANTR